MAMKSSQRFIRELLDSAGISVDGTRPFDIRVHDERFYDRVLVQGERGLGESYMDNWWHADAPDQFIEKILRADLQCKVKNNRTFFMNWFLAKVFNRQSRQRAFQVGEKHYDIGNDLYKRMLDKRMLYTCAYWKDAADLDQAQENKLRLICEKISLAPGMRVLDLGCGYGAFARYAAENYGVHVTGYTVSREQVNLGREMCKGLDVDLRLDDYRNAKGRFDRVVSIGIMEHVGPKNYGIYMQTAHQTLTDDGISFIHTIGHNQTRPVTNTWTEKYIFPNGKLPSIAQLGTAMEKGFVMEDWHNFGEDYDKTLMVWHHNFKTTWHEIKDRYSDRFYRMWEFYLLSCAGAFRARHIQLWQIVMTKTGRPAPECRKS